MAKVSGKVVALVGDQLGRVVPKSGTVRFMLVAPPQTPVPTDTSTGRPAQVHYDAGVSWNGEFTTEILPNDKISPPGTRYSVHILVPNIHAVPKFYEFRGPGPFDLDTMLPTHDPARLDPEMAERERANTLARATAARLRWQRAVEIRSQIALLQQELEQLSKQAAD